MDEIEWNVINEGQLLDAMVGHKPVGVNKYFQMALICHKFTEFLRKDVNPEKVWSHLATMYNLEILDENEQIPFPNNEKEFSLPNAEFGDLLTKKEEDKKTISIISGKKDTGNRSFKETTPRRESRDAKTTPSTNNSSNINKNKERLVNKFGKTRSSPKEKLEETPKPAKRTRGSLKNNDDSGSSGKSSPLTITPSSAKRRRVVQI